MIQIEGSLQLMKSSTKRSSLEIDSGMMLYLSLLYPEIKTLVTNTKVYFSRQ